VHGRTVFAFGHDFRVFGGALSEAHAAKIHKVMDLAAKAGAPLVGLCDGAGARIQVMLRKAYGGAYIVMDSRSIGADLSFAWPANEIAVMGAEGAANVIFRKEIANAPDLEAARTRKIEEYRRELMHPAYAAERGVVDNVIDPADTRSVLIRALEMLRHKHADQPERKHGNQPV
jgi:acetyl-CoA carboxylase carboxyltransferase component